MGFCRGFGMSADPAAAEYESRVFCDMIDLTLPGGMLRERVEKLYMIVRTVFELDRKTFDHPGWDRFP